MASALPQPLFLGVSLTAALVGISFVAAAQSTPAHQSPAVELASEDRDVLLADAEQFRQQRRWVDAIDRYQRVLDKHPGDRQAYHALVMTLSDNGNIARAWELYRARPQWFAADEALRLGNERVARLAGWGQSYPVSEDQAYDESNLALAEALAQRERLPQEPRDRSRRLDLDTLLILDQLERYPEAVALYRRLRAEDPVLPPYALTAAGDALLGIREPEEAAVALEEAVARNPDDFNARILLSYAYLESERFAPTYDLLRAARSAQAPWIRGEGARYVHANSRRYDADRTYGMALAQGEYLPEAQAEMEGFARIGPASAEVQQALGAVYYRRGWLERALERYEMASTLDERHIDARVGQTETLLDLHRADQATALHDTLVATRPRNVHVQRMDTYYLRHTGWQVAATAEGGRSRARDGALASASPFGSRDGGHAVDVQSPLLGDRWRLTASNHDRWADFGGARVHDRRIGAGVRYEYDRLDLRAYATRPDDGWSGKTGFGIEADWRFNDVLNGVLLLRRTDPDASLQARRAGITGDRIAVGLNYVPSERTTVSAAAEHWRYSDGNRRDVVGAHLNQRLLSRPHLLINGLVDASAGRGSRADAPYFNPGRDASLGVGVRIDHLAWRRYERFFRHRLSVTAGPYWQEGFGARIVPTARYEHEWSFGLGSTLVYGANWSRPVYDGVREHRIGFDIGVYWGIDR